MQPPLEQQTLDWLRQIPGDFLQLDESPLLGHPPAFPWEEFSKHLRHTFQIETLKFAPSEWQWRPKEELCTGLGDRLKCIHIAVTPIGAVCWIMPEQDISRMMHNLLLKSGDAGGKAFEDIDSAFREAFYRFLTLEVLQSFEKIEFDKQLSLTMMQSDALPSTHCLSLDVAIILKENLTLYGRLLLTPEFRKSWAQRYQQSPSLSSAGISDKLHVLIHLEAGKVKLKASEWKQIKIGDFLLLDSCSLNPQEDKGIIMLMINGTPFFRGRIKQGNIKILEHPLYYEVDTAMTNSSDNHNEESEHDEDNSEEDLEFEDTELESFEENEEDEEETMESEHSEMESEHSESDAGTMSDVETDIESELEDEDFEIEDEEQEASDSAPAAKAAPKTAAPPAQPAPASAGRQPMAVEDLPLNIVVEVGRLQMSVKKLLEIQPGNILELNLHPEACVDLVINGKRIAKGELLRIGEVLGVRIIELE